MLLHVRVAFNSWNSFFLEYNSTRFKAWSFLPRSAYRYAVRTIISFTVKWSSAFSLWRESYTNWKVGGCDSSSIPRAGSARHHRIYFVLCFVLILWPGSASAFTDWLQSIGPQQPRTILSARIIPLFNLHMSPADKPQENIITWQVYIMYLYLSSSLLYIGFSSILLNTHSISGMPPKFICFGVRKWTPERRHGLRIQNKFKSSRVAPH